LVGRLGVLRPTDEIQERIGHFIEVVNMPSKKTAFILGAGAHKPFGLPLGDELKEQIAQELQAIADDPRNGHSVRDHYLDLRRFIMDCGVSIDRFLSQHKSADNEVRPLIARCLLKKEKDNIDQPMKDWLHYLWQHIQGTKKYELSNRFVFITFNYDRTLEYRIARACDGLWGMGLGPALELVEETLTIYHVYGSLGNLSRINDASQYLPYGQVDGFEAAGKRIKIIGEHDTATTATVHKVLSDTESIYMLGCHCHKENMSLLALDKIQRKAYCSACGYRGAEVETLKKRFPYLIPQNEIWLAVDVLRNHKRFQELLARDEIEAAAAKIPAPTVVITEGYPT
jgi:hypothetical protein